MAKRGGAATLAGMLRNTGELPQQFTAELEGVQLDNVPVVGTLALALNRGQVGGDARANALGNFLEHFSSGSPPAGHEPRAALYELRNPKGEPFWIGRNSTMGQRNNRAIVEAFAKQAPPAGEPIAAGAGGFEERTSLLAELLGDAHSNELGPAAAALGQLIAALTSPEDEPATVEREIYVRTAILSDHSGEWTRAFIVDASPLSGPDVCAWFVVWTDAWTE